MYTLQRLLNVTYTLLTLGDSVLIRIHPFRLITHQFICIVRIEIGYCAHIIKSCVELCLIFTSLSYL